MKADFSALYGQHSLAALCTGPTLVPGVLVNQTKVILSSPVPQTCRNPTPLGYTTLLYCAGTEPAS